jgi:phenylalanyl-tRNA synthetase beta chain
MRIVWSWLRERCPTDATAEDLADRLTQRGVKVEAIERPWEGVRGVVVARVVEVADHPDSDSLCVATVDDGNDRLVVCAGVRNFRAGDLVPWAKPGARVPALPEPLAPRRLRGIVSHGMVCSARELAVADEHTAILLLNDEDVEPGDDVVTALGLDDEVVEIEVEPNRPDLLSVLGVAKEVAILTGVPLVPVDPAPEEEEEAEAVELATVRIEAPDGCPRYLARVIRGVDATRAAPIRARARLTAAGMRPISAVVDATNYAMIELGQPLHAFDMAELAGPGIVVRRAGETERVVTLDGVHRQLSAQDLLICDLERPVAIAGVMGGATSEVSERTRDVVLESASFTREGILRTARRLGLQTEASYRFERGVDPEAARPGVDLGAALIAEWAGGTVARGVVEAGAVPSRRWVAVRPARASSLVAQPLEHDDARAVFDALGMAHRDAGGAIEVEIPGSRPDIELEVDLIEEIARIRGYDRIGSTIPSAGRVGGAPAEYRFRSRVREALVRAGLREVRLLSFASGEDVRLFAGAEPVEVANPIQSEEGYLRTSLIPGLLRAVARNRSRGVATIAIFEVGTVFSLGDPIREEVRVAYAIGGPAGVAWHAERRDLDVLDAKGVLEALVVELGVEGWALGSGLPPPMHPGRSARVLLDGDPAGLIGELHPSTAEAFDLQGRVSVAELGVAELIWAARKDFVATWPPRFPPVRRDLAFELAGDVPAGEVLAAISEAGGELLSEVVLFDVFEGPPIREGAKSLAFALEIRSEERTLTDEEADEVVARIVERVATSFGGSLRAG